MQVKIEYFFELIGLFFGASKLKNRGFFEAESDRYRACE